jgi:uncharacterized protein YunC (DUF1805 family)
MLYTRRVGLIMICVVLLLTGCSKKEDEFVRIAAPDFKGNVNRFEKFGFSIRLYPEYKKVAERYNAVCFIPEDQMDKKTPDNVAVIFWPRDEGLFKKYKDAFSKPQNFQDVDILIKLEELGVTDKLIEAYKIDMENTDLACLFWTQESKLFKKCQRIRVEIFPDNGEQHITVVMKGKKEDVNKMLDMVDSIEIFSIEEKYLKELREARRRATGIGYCEHHHTHEH